MDEDHLVHGTEGTYHFFSPEMCARGYCGHDGRRADIWATGVCVWAFLLGTLPYWHKDLERESADLAHKRGFQKHTKTELQHVHVLQVQLS